MTAESQASLIVDGYYPDLSRAVYDGIDALNYSTLKHGLRSMKHMQHAMTHRPEPTPAMQLGTAIHLATFEPGELARQVVVARKFDRRTTLGKAEYAAFEAANADKIVLDGEDFIAVQGMAESLREHQDAAAFLALPAHNEATCVWTDEQTGVRMKARLDRYAHGDKMLADLKSTQNCHPQAWPKAVAQYSYHLQAAIYLEGIAQTRGDAASFLWLCVESEAPHCAAVYEIDSQSLDQGQREYRRLLNSVAECRKSGIWPGYTSDLLAVGLPAWACDGGL